MRGGPLSLRALVLTPSGRDGEIAAAILAEAGVATAICDDLPQLVAALSEGAGLAVIVEEVLRSADLSALAKWLAAQSSWSDFPFLLLTQRGGSAERNPFAKRLSATLGNVSFLERPFHPTTLVSSVRTALRARSRQYEARERIEEIRRAETLLERRVIERTAELEAANRQLASQIIERERAESALRQAQRLEEVTRKYFGKVHSLGLPGEHRSKDIAVVMIHRQVPGADQRAVGEVRPGGMHFFAPCQTSPQQEQDGPASMVGAQRAVFRDAAAKFGQDDNIGAGQFLRPEIGGKRIQTLAEPLHRWIHDDGLGDMGIPAAEIQGRGLQAYPSFDEACDLLQS